MRFTTLLGKFGAVSVAGILTIGGGLAFAEVADGTSTDPGTTEGTVTAPVEEVIPVDSGSDVTPVDNVVVDDGTATGTDTGTDSVVVDDGTDEGTIDQGTGEDVVVEEPAEAAEPAEHEHPENHGKHVSETAKTAPKGKGGVHGKAVSEVAHSDAGKHHSGGDDEGTVEAESTSGSHGGGEGGGHGKGHGGK